jgi:hypothetical protein
MQPNLFFLCCKVRTSRLQAKPYNTNYFLKRCPSILKNLNYLMKLSLILAGLLFFSHLPAFSQKMLVLDNFGTKRFYYRPGDAFYFKQKNDPTLFKDAINQINDTTIILESIREPLTLSNVEFVYRPVPIASALAAGLGFIGVGYTGSGLVGYARDEPGPDEYNHQDALWIGGSSLIAAAIVYQFRWKKWRIKEDKVRLRILDTSFEDVEAELEVENESESE